MLEPETQLGRYRLEERIARGGMAEIYRGRLDAAGGVSRPLVIKRILPEYVDDPIFVEMFLDEARLVAQLGHPNIVQLLDFGEEDGTFFMVMEHVEGPTLRALLTAARRAKHPLPPRIAAAICAQVAVGLHHAHTRRARDGQPLKIVHRDISPSNILVSVDGMAKILDFGIAKAAISMHTTATGVLKGKLPYMTREQLMDEPIDHRVDIYALGVVLYVATVGKLPVNARSDFDLMARITEGQLIKPREVMPDYPADLEAIVLNALALSADDRFRDGRAFADALRALELGGKGPASSFEIAEFVEALDDRYDGDLITLSLSPGGDGLEPNIAAPDNSEEESFQPFVSDQTDPEEPPSSPWSTQDPTLREPVPSGLEFDPNPTVKTSLPSDAGPTFADTPLDAPALVMNMGDATVVDSSAAAHAAEMVRGAALPTVVVTPPPNLRKLAMMGAAGLLSLVLVVWMASGDDQSGEEESPPVAPATSEIIAADDAAQAETQNVAAAVEEGTAGALPAVEVQVDPPEPSDEADTQKDTAASSAPVVRAPKRSPRRKPRPQSAKPGTLSVLVRPWGVVYVNGKKRGTTPMAPIRLPAGRYDLRIEQPSTGKNMRREVTVPAGQKTVAKFDLTK